MFEKQEFKPYTQRNWRNDHWLAVRASEDETSDTFGECIFGVSAYIPSFRMQRECHRASNTIDNFFVETTQMSSSSTI